MHKLHNILDFPNYNNQSYEQDKYLSIAHNEHMQIHQFEEKGIPLYFPAFESPVLDIY